MNSIASKVEVSKTVKTVVPGRGPTAKAPADEAVLTGIWEQKWSRARKHITYMRLFALACFIGSPVCVYIFGPNAWTFGLFMGVVLAGDVARVDELTEAEYCSVPGSQDKAGKLRCIYCGHKSTETHWHGRSAMIKEVRCHACQEQLF